MAEVPRSILIVDDEENILDITAMVLEMEGYVVRTALNGAQAIDLLKNFIPDLIISDIIMPGMNGIEFFRQVRSNPQIQHIPFIFVTAQSDNATVMMGKELGSDDYLTKPVDPNLLLSTIKGKLKRKDQLADSLSQQVDQIKNQLLRLISHEMRTPLTSILGATEVLSDTNETLSPKELTEFLEMLQSNSKRLSAMVDDFLLATKIESGEMLRELQISSVQLSPYEMIDRILRDVEQKILHYNVTIENSVPNKQISFSVYMPHLEIILRRLIDNAMKFSASGGKVLITLTEKDRSYIFAVKDAGCGIPKGKQDELFKKFQQVNREKNEQQGAGLGLFIASRLAQANHVELAFDSEEGKGST
ncbi:MAG: response regulator, partial [Bacteroidota bacterium]|nr:response regulator [Bacteroidota bacterium]